MASQQPQYTHEYQPQPQYHHDYQHHPDYQSQQPQIPLPHHPPYAPQHPHSLTHPYIPLPPHSYPPYPQQSQQYSQHYPPQQQQHYPPYHPYSYPDPPPPQPSLPPHPPHHRSKRAREAHPIDPTEGSNPPSNKRQFLGNDILFRVVVPSSQIGKVIGKGGHRVQKIRDGTKATVKIADAIARYEERVIIISSKEKDGGITDAENALLQIASLILVDDGTGTQTVSAVAAGSVADPYAGVAVGGPGAVGTAIDATTGHVVSNSVKLLIAGSQAGSLIGVSGQNIEKLRNSSGASVTVLAPNQLPLCASAHESDRLVQISGEVPAVLKAVEEIGAELRLNPPKQVISISPTYNLTVARAAQQYMDPNATDYVTLDMVISETMIGGLIGRAGSNIQRIRTETGAMIKVFGGKGSQKLRQIQLIGSAPQVELAKQRVDEYVYSQLTQQSDS